MPHRFLGIGLFLLSCLFFTVTYAFYKACEPFLSSAQILCLSNLCSWLIILPWVLPKGYTFLATERLPLIALRTVLGIGSIYSITLALQTITLSETMLLNNTAPLFIPFIVWFWDKIKISRTLWTGLIIGFIGVIIILRPSFGEVNRGLFFGLFSGFATAAMLVVIRRIAHEPFMRILFYYFLIFWAALTPSLMTDWTLPPPEICLFLALGGIGMVAAQLTLTSTFRFISSHEAAPFIYSSVVFGALIDWFIWNRAPAPMAILGMVIVCTGSILALKAKEK